jgi:hypothetical protein
MRFRLFPNPSTDACTPFVFVRDRNCYGRAFDDGQVAKAITIQRRGNADSVVVEGANACEVVGRRVPDRRELLRYVRGRRSVSQEFVDYLSSVFVVPTFSLCPVESFVRTVIRQLISAKQARQLFARFVRTFGVECDGFFGFPNGSRLAAVSQSNFLEIGLGMKAARIHAGVRRMRAGRVGSPQMLPGVGPWSRQILEVERCKSYRHYPFWDKSGEKIKKVCGIDVTGLAGQDPELAGDLYVYGASFLESRR